MSRRKQTNPKPTKVEDDAMKSEQDTISDLKSQQNSYDSSHMSDKDNSDFEDDSNKLTIVMTPILSSPSSLTPGGAIGDVIDQVTEIPLVVSDGDSKMVDADFQACDSEYGDAFFKETVTEIVIDDLVRKSRSGSVSSNFSEKDIASVSGSISNGEMSLNLSSLSVTDALLLSDGSGALKNSLSKSRKKSDLILPKQGNNGEENFSCPICQEVLATNHDFTCHIRSHNSPTNTSTINACTICGKVLSSQSSLDRHMLVHSGERPFRCKICEMAFTTNGNMHRHMRIHEKNFQQSSADGAALANGLIAKPRRKKKLLPAKTDTTSKHDPQPEIPIGVNLSLWNQNGSSLVERKRKSDILGDDEFEKEGTKKLIQEIEVTKRLVLASRRLSSVRKKAVDRAMKVLPMTTTFQRISSINPNRSPTKCPECQQKFFSKLCLANDLEEHERQRGTSLSVFCIACETMIQNSTLFRDHLMSAHNEERETVTASVIAQNDLARLEFSSRNFPLIAKLYAERLPRRPAGKDLPYFCSPCERSFMCEESLALHTSEHTSDQSKTCTTCGTCTKTREQYEQHALMHESETIVSGFTKRPRKNLEAVQDGISPQEFMLVLGMRRTDNTVTKPDREMKDSLEIIPSNGLVGGDLSFDDNQNLVGVLSLSEQPSGSHQERSTTPRMVTPSSLLSILPRMTGKIATKLLNSKTTHSNDLIRISETPSGVNATALKDRNMMVVTNVSSIPAKCVDINILNGGLGLTRIEILANGENGNEDAGSGISGSSPKGSLPFKCSECSYSSTDKSTLLRHERKHNGQRPFQCRICDFAFTTKANCERHVRKKHPMGEGQRLEDAIGYTRFASELGIDSTPSSMLETVCKFCREDFKFYRALKHHLRSQTSCQYKPCQCKICNLRFSTKANCWRHLLKKHGTEMVRPIESYMSVNARSRLDETLGCDSSVLTPNGEMEDCSKRLNLEVKDEAVSMPPRDVVTVLNLQKTASGALYHGLVDENEDSDEPLDFSLKSQKITVPSKSHHSTRSQVLNSWSGDEPIDLTVKGEGHQNHTPRESGCTTLQVESSPFDLKLISRACGSEFEKSVANLLVETPSVLRNCLPLQFGSVDSSFSCTKCRLVFKHRHELSTHLRTHHTREVSMFSCSHCTCAFPNKVQLDLHVKSRHRIQFTGVTSSSFPRSSISLLKEPNNNSHELKNANLLHKRKHVKPSQMSSVSCDFASVPRILKSTNGRQLKSILAIAKSSALVPATTAVHGQSNLENFTKDNNHVITTIESTTPSVVQKYDDEYDEANEMDSLSNRNRNQKQEIKERKNVAESGVVKRKRNSYADSPHKLHCSFCSRAFPWISSLKRHLLTHTGQKPYRCKHCTVTFSTKSNRERHMIRKHGLDVHDPATRQTMDRPFKCHYCVFSSFTTSGKLLRHYSSKHPDRDLPETLIQCTGSQLQDESSDKTSWSESGDPSSETLKLDQSFDFRDNSIDEDDESGDEETDEETKEVEELTNSLMMNMNRKTRNLVQSVVSSAEVASVAQLLAQEQTSKAVTTSDCFLDKRVNPERDNYNVDKITECWKCKKAFDCRKTLLRHLKEHSIDLPFKCYLCDASFENRLVSLSHKRDEHPSDWATVQDKSRVSDLAEYSAFMESVVRDTLDGKVTRRTHEGVELDIRPESDYAQRKVFCTLCPKRFWSLQDLRRHMRSHTGDRPFECDICLTRFTLKHSMMRHRRKHLNESVGAGAEAQCSTSDDDSINTSAVPVEVGPETKGISPELSKDGNSIRAIALVGTELDISQSRPEVDADSTISSSKFTDSDPIAVKLSSSNRPDLLESLLGIEDRSTIDRMLESPNNAASMLGIQRSKNESIA